MACSNRKPNKDNLTHSERNALRDLRENNDIITKPADKGGAVIILNTTDYTEKGEAYVKDETTYKVLPCLRRDPLESHLKTIKQVVDQFEIVPEIFLFFFYFDF